MLPADLARTMSAIENSTRFYPLVWRALVYATGIGCVRLEGKPTALRNALELLRAEMEAHGGSLVALRRPETLSDFDTWGSPGDALPLMKAVKHRLDDKNTLNPGRFVGGI